MNGECLYWNVGQTGAGKTFTMFGPDKIETLEDRGIIPRTSAYGSPIYLIYLSIFSLFLFLFFCLF